MQSFLTEYDTVLEIVIAFCLVFLGNFVLSKTKTGKNTPPLLRFIFCTAFTYFATVVREMVQFFMDYYIPSSWLQDYGFVPDESFFFFKIFGKGAFGVNQYPVYDTMLDFLMMIIGCAIGGGVLLLIYAKKQKNEKVKENDTETQAISV